MTRLDEGKRPPADAKAGRNDAGDLITPMESVLAAENVEKLHENARRAENAAPPRMDALTPISRPAAAETFARGTVPPVGRITRTIPAPYQRPRISIDHHGREWHYRGARLVREGDLVVDVGQVELVEHQLEYEEVIPGHEAPVADWVILTNVLGERHQFPADEQLRTFGRVEELGD